MYDRWSPDFLHLVVMSPNGQKSDSVCFGGGKFCTTHWSVVLSAREPTSSQAREASETLCGTYWYPLYAYLRRLGYTPHDSQDLTQGFFAQLLEKNALLSVDRRKGKFRTFLLASLKHFLSNERDRARALKRGGNKIFCSLNDEDPENRYAREPASNVTPDKAFELSWLRTILAQALARLRAEFSAKGRAEQFEQLKDFLTEEAGGSGYATVAKCLQTSTGAVAVAVHRMRERYRELVREEIARTVTNPVEVEEEIRHLLAALN